MAKVWEGEWSASPPNYETGND